MLTPDRVRQIEELYHSAREASADERAILLAQADPELRREIESLLARQNDHLIIDPSTGLSNNDTITTLARGARLGPYQVENKIGQGGMGEVFRALDTRLGRPVAIKFAHERFTDRFEREARAIAALNHPNVCTLYDVGPNYLVMELLEGETIAARLKNGPLPAAEAVKYASQIVAALAEAHERGIIHRDLKPGNVMLTKSGVKVLDFGLATWEGDDSITGSNMMVGTPAYMAPEQREGKPADVRTDLYSFGCIFYEMLTGSRATADRKPVPSRALEKVVSRCLETDPARRWQSIAELQNALEARPAAEKKRNWVIPVAAILAGFVILMGGYFFFHRPPKLTEEDNIILADFANSTGDPVFDDTLRQGLSVELQQSPFLTIVADNKVQQQLVLMGQPKGARLTAEIAQQICERTGSAAVLEGSIAPNGSQYVLGLRAKNCNTGKILDQEQAVAAKREDVLNTLSQIVRKFRTRAGESLATVDRHSTPLAEATTPSLEALKAYSTGIKTALTSGNAAAVPFYQRAVEIDPKFAVAYAQLGLSYSAIGESVLSAESTKKAWLMRDRVTDREKFFIDFTYDRQVTGNLEKAYQTLELWSQTYPRGGNPNPQGLLAGLSTNGTGRFERSIQAAKESIAAEPDSALRYNNLAQSYFLTGRFSEAESTIHRAYDRKLQMPDLLVIQYNIAALRGDREQMDQIVAQAKGKRRAEHWIAHQEALVLARSGRLKAAAQSSNRAVELALQEGQREEAAAYRAARAFWEAIFGNSAEGKRNAAAALELSKGLEVEYAAGLALAFSGDLSGSAALAGDLEKRFPEDTFAKFHYVPVLRALESLAQGKPADSVERLQMTLRYQLAPNGLLFSHYYLGALHSAYVRGEALSAAARYPEAGVELQKILDNRGIVALDPIGAMAHLRLGRAYALSGDNAKAKSAYESFLTLWKDADAGLSIHQQARAEYAKLR